MPQQIYFQPGDMVETAECGDCIILTQSYAQNTQYPLYHVWSYSEKRYIYHIQHNMAIRKNATEKTKAEAYELLMRLLNPSPPNLMYKKGDRIKYGRSQYAVLNAFLDYKRNEYYLIYDLKTGGIRYIDKPTTEQKLADANDKAQARAQKILIARVIAPGFPD